MMLNKYVVLLRGINVGGKRKIKMADLKELLSIINYQNISTYIQSGNVILETSESLEKLQTEITKTIHKNYGFKIPVIAVNTNLFTEILTLNPFLSKAETEQLHVTFLKEIPEKKLIENLKNKYNGQDEFKIIDKFIFIKCEGRYSASKLTNLFFEKHLKVETTTRNWKTIIKLTELIQND